MSSPRWRSPCEGQRRLLRAAKWIITIIATITFALLHVARFIYRARRRSYATSHYKSPDGDAMTVTRREGRKLALESLFNCFERGRSAIREQRWKTENWKKLSNGHYLFEDFRHRRGKNSCILRDFFIAVNSRCIDAIFFGGRRMYWRTFRNFFIQHYFWHLLKKKIL